MRVLACMLGALGTVLVAASGCAIREFLVALYFCDNPIWWSDTIDQNQPWTWEWYVGCCSAGWLVWQYVAVHGVVVIAGLALLGWSALAWTTALRRSRP